MNTPDEMIAVIQAHKDKKPLQMRLPREGDNDWLDIPNPTFRFHDTLYRIKPPESREWWLDDSHVGYGTRDSAVQIGGSKNPVHVREVLP